MDELHLLYDAAKLRNATSSNGIVLWKLYCSCADVYSIGP